MTVNDLCAAIGQSLPPPFACSPAPQESVRVRTPMLYPDGTVVDVFVLERDGGYTITDFGDTLGWLSLQSATQRRSQRQQLLVEELCQSLRIELVQERLVLRAATRESLGEAVLRLSQAAVRVSDLWFTLRSQSLQHTADEVSEWLREKKIPFDRQVQRQGRSGQTWSIDFETHTDDQSCLVFLLSTGSRDAVRRLAEHVLAGCVDLAHFTGAPFGLTFISLFDDTEDVWCPEDFSLVEEHSEIARWSRPDQFEELLRGG